ncbi:MAG: DUF1538 domain-containing protein [Gammaproteobacteria bacterium]|nr:DUF1538 domain-containing protein [Gammaproteobacteria bacterium]
MSRQYRFGDVQRRSRGKHKEYSINAITPKLERDANGNLIPYRTPRFKLNLVEVYNLLRPYVLVRMMEQVKAVVPLALYLLLFQVLILRQLEAHYLIITGGLFAVIVGLMFFMEGLKSGLMPFGTVIGRTLPRNSSLPVVLLITLLLGIGVTFAEPAIGALKAVGKNVSVEQAPYLYTLLNAWSDILVLVVGASVGLAAVLGTLRFLYGWSLKPMIYMALVPVLGLTLLAAIDPQLQEIIGLAWDCGAVTTGPVTVPLVLSLGIGIAAAAGKGESGLSGFGIVTLASLFPITGVLLLAFYISFTQSPAEIIEAARMASAAASNMEPAWYQSSPGEEIVLGIRAILPLVIFLYLVLRFVLHEPLKNPGEIIYGIVLATIGMCIFNLGLTYGLSKLGGDVGNLVPAAFTPVPGVEISPIYIYSIGVGLALLFAWAMGFGATLAEPALNALGETTELLTNGVFKKKTLLLAVSFGVAFGIAAGVAKLIYAFPLVWLIVPGYLLAIVLTYFSSEEFVNIAWDSAGVTTGPITVPLVLAMGLGIGNAMSAIEGFGILCLASIGPIVSVMITGLWARYKAEAGAKRISTSASQKNEAQVLI